MIPRQDSAGLAWPRHIYAFGVFWTEGIKWIFSRRWLDELPKVEDPTIKNGAWNTNTWDLSWLNHFFIGQSFWQSNTWWDNEVDHGWWSRKRLLSFLGDMQQLNRIEEMSRDACGKPSAIIPFRYDGYHPIVVRLGLVWDGLCFQTIALIVYQTKGTSDLMQWRYFFLSQYFGIQPTQPVQMPRYFWKGDSKQPQVITSGAFLLPGGEFLLRKLAHFWNFCNLTTVGCEAKCQTIIVGVRCPPFWEHNMGTNHHSCVRVVNDSDWSWTRSHADRGRIKNPVWVGLTPGVVQVAV